MQKYNYKQDEVIKKIKNILNDEKKVFFIISLISLVMVFLISQNDSDNQTASKTESANIRASASIDTYIPRGFVLIPIEVKNLETLDSLLDTHGVVNIYSSIKNGFNEPQGFSTKPIARRIKIIRSPKNPLKFAVLAPEDQSSQIVKAPSPFYVTIQNPKLENLEIQKKTKPKRRIIKNSL